MKVLLITVFLAFTVQSIANEYNSTIDDWVDIENTTVQNEEKFKINVKKNIMKDKHAVNSAEIILWATAIAFSILLLLMVAVSLILVYLPYWNNRRRNLSKRARLNTSETVELQMKKRDTVDRGVGTDPECECQQSYCGRCTINLLAEARKCYEREMPRRPFIYS